MAFLERFASRSRTNDPMTEPWDVWGLHGAVDDGRLTGPDPRYFVRQSDGTFSFDPHPMTPERLAVFEELIAELHADD